MKRLYYNRRQEQCLTYTPQNGDTLTSYVVAALETALPDKPEVVLRHMTYFAAVVEELLDALQRANDDAVTQMMGDMRLEEAPDAYADLRRAFASDVEEEEEEEPSTVHEIVEDNTDLCTQLLTVAWLWHSDMAARPDVMTGHFANAFFLSWTTLSQLFFLQLHSSPLWHQRLLRARAQDYAFYQAVARRHHIEISTEPLRMYSLSDLWVAMDLIVSEGLYSEPYSTEMREYVYALYARYCELFTVALGDIECVLDNPLFYERRRTAQELELERATDTLNGLVQNDELVGEQEEPGDDDDEEDQFEAYKHVTIPVSDTLALRSEYVYDGQVMFYSQLYRINLSERLAQMEQASPLVLTQGLPDTQRQAQTRACWLRFLSAVTRHADLAGFVSTDFKNDLMQLHLRHGETEQYKRRWPNSKAQPNDVLGQMRPSISGLGETHTTPPCLIVESHQKEPTKHVLECIYLTRQCQARWQASIKVNKHSVLKERFMMEQLSPLSAVDAAITRSAHEVPLFLVLMQRYYVVWGERVFSSHCFVTAYVVWLALLVARKALLRKQVHQSMWSTLQYYAVK